MTDDDKKLVEMLRDDHQYILVEGHNVTDWDSIEAQRFEAADRIEALTAEKEAVRMEERAAIVAWMMREEKEYPSTEYSGFVAMIREEIEAGEHLK